MFISMAHAAPAAAASAESSFLSFVPLIVIFVVFWFLMIRPQMKQAKERQKMIDGVQAGDEVVTNGGVLGKIASINEQYLSLEIAQGVEIQVLKSAVQTVLPKGTLKI